MSDTITLEIPISLCPQILGKNGGNGWGWAAKNRAFRDQKAWAEYALYERIKAGHWERWPAAIMHVNWEYNRGRPPDDDNAIARLAAVRDAFEAAGVVSDDRHISIGTVTFTKVPQTDNPLAIVTLEQEQPELVNSGAGLLMSAKCAKQSVSQLVCRNATCSQVVAVRVGGNVWRSLGADVVAGDHGRQVFVCPVCETRTRAPRGVDDCCESA
jgi:hypothetical protein